jgi:hypothetical protein
MVWLEGNMSLKNPVTPPGIDPWTVRLVAQRLSHYATPGHCIVLLESKKPLLLILNVSSVMLLPVSQENLEL